MRREPLHPRRGGRLLRGATLFGICLPLLGLGTLPGFGQPAQSYAGNCTVTMLNQTARVPANGRWLIPAVPNNMGAVRARLTCTHEGQTQTGYSAAFPITRFRFNSVSPVILGQGDPTPESLELTLPSTQINQVGAALQATVLATLPDGTVLDVSTAADGTLYASTNPAVASVSADGQITALSSGRVLISALHEAILDTELLTVTLSGDDDGDGMPNDFELANGLSPNDPADAFEDADGDGLGNRAEFDLGTGVRNRDSDGDAIDDGEELIAGQDGFVTNPLLADTDGDAVNDGLERFVGTDPTNPASVNYAAVVTGITVSPPAFTLIKNTLFVEEVSRRLRVTGTLIDGTSADLTSRGVSYGYGNLDIALPGADPGRVVAGLQDGTTTVTAMIAGRTAVSQVTVQTFSPTPLSFLPIPGFANSVTLAGNHAFIAAGATGLQVVNVTNPLAPTLVGSVDTPGNANDVVVAGDFAYVADGVAGLAVIDVSAPATPQLIARVVLPGDATDLSVVAGRAYVAAAMGGFHIVDVTVPQGPQLLGSVSSATLGDRGVRAVAVDPPAAVLTLTPGNVRMVDVTNPTAPRLEGFLYHFSPSELLLVGPRRAVYARTADGSPRSELTIVDFSHAKVPAWGGETSPVYFGGPTALAAERSLIFAADFYWDNQVLAWNSAAPVPFALPRINLYKPPAFPRKDNGNGIAVRNGLLYVVGNQGSIADNGVSGDSALHIARYALYPEDDGQPPTIEFAVPAVGASLRERRQLTLRANAADDVLVESVSFFVGGELIGRDFAPPYEASYVAPSGSSTVLLMAVATDLGGNQTSAERSLVITPDNRPTIVITSPVDGRQLPEGSLVAVAIEATDDLAVHRVEVFRDGQQIAELTAPPYTIDIPVALEVASLTIAATAFDSAGQSAQAGPVTVNFQLNQPPTVTILEPAQGGAVIEGHSLEVHAGAVDDVAVSRVDFFLDGELVGQDTAPPFVFTGTVPPAPAVFELTATAYDARGASGTSAAVSVQVVADPGTTLTGVVVANDGSVVSGAEVSCLGLVGLTDGAGQFSIPGLPTNQGHLIATVTLASDGGEASGASAPTFPIPGGLTDVGVIRLNQPPVVDLIEPLAHLPVIAGATVQVTARVIDDLGVSAVLFYREGQLVLTDTAPPFAYSFVAPTAPAQVTFTAEAFDHQGLSSVSLPLVLAVVPDPGTTVVGVVHAPDGSPAANVVVTVLGVTGSTGFDGHLSLPGVPTTQGPLVVNASRAATGGFEVGNSAPAAPVAGGITDVGLIELTFTAGSSNLDPDIGSQLGLSDDGTVFVPFSQGFQFYFGSGLQSGLWVNANGNVSFGLSGSSSAQGLDLLARTRQQIAPFYTNLTPDQAPAGGGVFVKQHPDRLLVSWIRVPQEGVGENSFQVELFQDGRIRFRYGDIDSLGGSSRTSLIVTGISHGVATLSNLFFDWTSAGTKSFTRLQSAYSAWNGSTPFNLGGGTLLFTPQAANLGGYTATWTPAP